MPALVSYHKDFYEGVERNEYFSDFSRLSEKEADFLCSFITNVKLGFLLDGKNKESWKNDNGEDIFDAKTYKSCKLWHHHIGPYLDIINDNKSKIRNINLLGKTSGPIVHYKWYNEEKKHLIIVAFSSKHKPYPSSKNKNNPLGKRSGLIISSNLISV